MTVARGARAALDTMNSMSSLASITKNILKGDKIAYIFPVEGVDEDGYPIITVASRLGHSLDLGEESKFRRSFIPTNSTIGLNNKVIEADFAYSVSPIFSALISADREKRETAIKNDPDMSDAAKKIELGEVDKEFKNKYPAVSRLGLRVYAEVAMVKLDVDNKIIGDKIDPYYGTLQISKKKLNQLIALTETKGAFTPDMKYFYIIMQCTNDDDKKKITQADWTTLSKEEDRLEAKNPGFADAVTKLFATKRPTVEGIEAKIYDFNEYNENEFKDAVKEYVSDRKYKLYGSDKKPFSSILKTQNVDALQKLGLMSTAEDIARLLEPDKANESQTENPAPHANVADSFNEQFAKQSVEGTQTPFDQQTSPGAEGNMSMETPPTSANGTMQI